MAVVLTLAASAALWLATWRWTMPLGVAAVFGGHAANALEIEFWTGAIDPFLMSGSFMNLADLAVWVGTFQIIMMITEMVRRRIREGVPLDVQVRIGANARPDDRGRVRFWSLVLAALIPLWLVLWDLRVSVHRFASGGSAPFELPLIGWMYSRPCTTPPSWMRMAADRMSPATMPVD